MTDTPNPEDLARLYLEFWQQPLAGLTRDPQVAESIARMFDLMTAGATTFAKIVAGAEGPGAPGGVMPSGMHPHDGRQNQRPDAAPAAHPKASAAIDARLDQIARRVAELERRVAGLEPRARVRRARAPGRSRRPRRPA